MKLMILFLLTPGCVTSPAQPPEFMSFKELKSVHTTCQGEMGCISNSFASSPKVPSVDTRLKIVAEVEAQKNKFMLSQLSSNYTSYFVELPDGPEATVVVEKTFKKEFLQAIKTDQTVKIGILRGISFLHVPRSASSTWKNDHYNPVLKRLSLLESNIEKFK